MLFSSRVTLISNKMTPILSKMTLTLSPNICSHACSVGTFPTLLTFKLQFYKVTLISNKMTLILYSYLIQVHTYSHAWSAGKFPTPIQLHFYPLCYFSSKLTFTLLFPVTARFHYRSSILMYALITSVM